MPAITPETARANQAKGVETKRARRQAALKALSAVETKVDYEMFTKTLIGHTQAILSSLSLRLVPLPTSVDSIEQLTRSLERVFHVWAHLTLTPGVADVRIDQTKKLMKAIGPRRAIEAIINDPTLAIVETTPTTSEPQPTTTTDDAGKESLNAPEPTVGAPGEGEGGQ